jgi:signal transduction histidine kinase
MGGGGLDTLDKRTLRFAHYRHIPEDTLSLSYNSVRTLYEDRKGTLWVGTGAGLNKFERSTGSFKRYTTRDGIESDQITGILEDDRGNLWLGTGKGVSRFDPESGMFRNFDVSDGVRIFQSREHSCYRNRSGEMYFGGVNGFVRFHPDSIKDNPYVPPIVITAFKVFDRLLPLDSAISDKHIISLTHKDNVFSFEFAALNYTSPEKNQYAYKLDGFDRDWVYCRTQRHATYTNLDGGSYVFRVKGSNNDGVWNETGISIHVIITPPFWATWWFRIALFVVTILTTGGTIRFVEFQKIKRKIAQLERSHAIERERLRISQDMHDEVGANLTKIAIISELAMKNARDADGMTTQLQNISHTAREVIDSISAIVWAINPTNDKLDNLAGYIREYASDYFEMTPIRCMIDFPQELPDHALSAEVRRNIFLTMKEAMNNVVRHSAATTVRICMVLRDRHVEMSIEDNGRGFAIDDISRYGNGLTNMRRRVETINGTFDVQSQPGAGTRILVHVPLT